MKLNITRRSLLRSSLLVGTAGALGAPAVAGATSAQECRIRVRSGKLFMSTNGVSGNEVQVYDRLDEGPVGLLFSVPTAGVGTGSGLASQGAVTLSGDGRYLFVVNAGSNTLTTFWVGKEGLELRSTVATGGPTPTSVTENDGLVYVMNSGMNGTGIGSGITGFRNARGALKPIANSSRTLGLSGGPVLGQVGLGVDGGVIVVTDRNNTVYSWTVQRDGTPGPLTRTPSPGAVPFGFAFTRRDVMIVSEAGGSATSGGSTCSSYVFNPRTLAPGLVSAAVPTTQGAACWVAVTPDGRYAFSANAASSTVSSFRVARSGTLTLLNAQAALMAGAGALDMAVSPDGSQLHVFGSRTPQSLFTYAIDDGALTLLGSSVGPVAGAAGLAAN
jgi:6-phosphogluconolactonase